ncbi:hypothetical protein [Halobacillus salinus]|uniref:hypothetical protein n=1 Tax=Halobacillus salinus TaxID=192814 RepID=UPI0009A59348|nr:hypothetical protein [Halobacillus salinus]
MAKFRQVYTEFWEDITVEGMTPEDKLFYLYLLTNSHTTQIGVYQITKKRMAFELGYSPESLDGLFERFINHHEVMKYNDKTSEIAIKNWGKYNLNRGGKPVEDCIKRELPGVKDSTLIEYVAEQIPDDSKVKHLFEPYTDKHDEPLDDKGHDSSYDSWDESCNDTPHDEGGRTNKNKKNNKNKKEGRDSSPSQSKKYDASSLYYQMAERLFEKILENNPDHKEPNLQKWSDDFRKIVEIDNRKSDVVFKMIDWVQKNDFWHTNILSPDKLRKQWDRLKLEVVRESNKGGQGNGTHQESAEAGKDFSSGRKHLLG